jgi:hypothetical protein
MSPRAAPGSHRLAELVEVAAIRAGLQPVTKSRPPEKQA